MQTENISTDTLMTEYLNVVNTALDRNKNSFPYDYIIKATEKLSKDKEFGIAVYKNDPKSPHDYYTVNFDNGHINLLAHGKQNPDIDWKFDEDYMRNVVEEPKKYIESPAKLDLDWLKERLGISS